MYSHCPLILSLTTVQNASVTRWILGVEEFLRHQEFCSGYNRADTNLTQLRLCLLANSIRCPRRRAQSHKSVSHFREPLSSGRLSHLYFCLPDQKSGFLGLSPGVPLITVSGSQISGKCNVYHLISKGYNKGSMSTDKKMHIRHMGRKWSSRNLQVFSYLKVLQTQSSWFFMDVQFHTKILFHPSTLVIFLSLSFPFYPRGWWGREAGRCG